MPERRPDRGGEVTNKGTSFCAPHHHMADHPQTYDMTRLPNGKIRFTRRQ